MGRLSKLIGLKPADQALIVLTTWLLLVAMVGLATVGLDRTYRLIDRLSSVARVVPKPPEHRILWALDVGTTTLPLEVDCLPRAFVGQCLLSDCGIDAVVRIGVRNGTDGFEAHAWVERRDEVVIGQLDGLDRFQPITEFSGDTTHSRSASPVEPA